MLTVVQKFPNISAAAQYEALTAEHVAGILECPFCLESFEFVTEWITHLQLKESCREELRYLSSNLS